VLLTYLEQAALKSCNDLQLWYRYLNKYVKNNKFLLKEPLFKKLLLSRYLTKAQKDILYKIVTNCDSYEHRKVCSLSKIQNHLKKEHFSIQQSNITITDHIFDCLNNKLEEHGLELAIICAGGFVLQTLGIRTTIDVDAFYSCSSEIEQLIKEVGNIFNINQEEELWLNNSIANLNRVPSQKWCKIYKKYSNLTVYMVIPEYLIGMKLESGREKDQRDISAIIQQLDLDNPILLYKKLIQMNFNIDFSDLLFAFGLALGTTWWKQYIKEHQQEILTLS
jgi:hypothetical protein